jgi:predicted membrane-bound spermidine synthase
MPQSRFLAGPDADSRAAFGLDVAISVGAGVSLIACLMFVNQHAFGYADVTWWVYSLIWVRLLIPPLLVGIVCAAFLAPSPGLRRRLLAVSLVAALATLEALFLMRASLETSATAVLAVCAVTAALFVAAVKREERA